MEMKGIDVQGAFLVGHFSDEEALNMKVPQVFEINY
jgi:hypothetical protein